MDEGYPEYQLTEKIILYLELRKESRKFEVLAQQYRFWLKCLNQDPGNDNLYTKLLHAIREKLKPENFPHQDDDIKNTIEKYNNAILNFKQIYASFQPGILSFYKEHHERINNFGAFAYLPDIAAKLDYTKKKFYLTDLHNFLKSEFKPYELEGIYLDQNSRKHLARQAIIKGIVFQINSRNAGGYGVYQQAQQNADEINKALQQKNRWFLRIEERDIPAYILMKDLFDKLYTKADPKQCTDEEAYEFYVNHPSLFKRDTTRYMEVLEVLKLSPEERPHEVIRRFRQTGINALLPKYDINKPLPFFTFTLGKNLYPHDAIINHITEKLKNSGKWSIAYGQSSDKNKKYYIRVDEIYPGIDKNFEEAKDEIKKYCSFLKSQKAFLKQLGIVLEF